MTGGPFMDINTAAEYLAVCPRTIRRRLREIPHVRCDWGLRFSRPDLDAYMAARRVEPPKVKRRSPDEILASIGLGRGGRRDGR